MLISRYIMYNISDMSYTGCTYPVTGLLHCQHTCLIFLNPGWHQMVPPNSANINYWDKLVWEVIIWNMWYFSLLCMGNTWNISCLITFQTWVVYVGGEDKQSTMNLFQGLTRAKICLWLIPWGPSTLYTGIQGTYAAFLRTCNQPLLGM